MHVINTTLESLELKKTIFVPLLQSKPYIDTFFLKSEKVWSYAGQRQHPTISIVFDPLSLILKKYRINEENIIMKCIFISQITLNFLGSYLDLHIRMITLVCRGLYNIISLLSNLDCWKSKQRINYTPKGCKWSKILKEPRNPTLG